MKLKNDLIVLDIESTGTWVERDRIIEIALVKCSPEGNRETFHKRINPGMPIPKIVTDLTGIADKDVEGAPVFKQLARSILDFIGGADFGGFNVERFDLPMLEREFADSGINFEWKSRKIYDAQKVYHLNEKRDLSAAYQFYCGKDLVGAHSALADSEATLDILKQQIIKYGGGAEELSVLEQFEYSSGMDAYDKERKFCWWNNKLYPVFGKYAKKLSLEEIAKVDSGYLNWVLKADFSENVKTIVRNALNGQIPVRTSKP